MNLLRFLLKASKGVVALSVLAGVAGGVGGIGLIALIQAELARDRPSTWPMGAAFAGLCLASALLRVASQATMIRLAQGSVSRLCLHLCAKILALPLRQFEEIDPAALLAALTEDVVIVANALAGIPLVSISTTIVVVGLGYVGWLSPPALFCALIFVAPAVLGFRALADRGVRHLRSARARQDRLVGHFRSLLDGFRELKLHRARRKAFLSQALRSESEAVRDRTVDGLGLFAAAGSWGQLGFFGFIGFLLFALPGFYDLGRPTIAGVLMVVFFIMTPLEVILTWAPNLGRARVSLQKIEALLPRLDAGEIADFPSPIHLAFHESLELRGVTHTYRGGPDGDGFRFGASDFILHPGEIVFLVGGNGSGKTTLVKLLAGLYEPDCGEIVLDGRMIDDSEREAYRQLFSVVFADGHLFPTLFGLEADGLDARANNELARLKLASRVRVEDATFSTIELSMGQRKRLALLSAMLEDRPILILDEWASHQDFQFKGIFYEELLPAWKVQGKTLLVITHDHDYFHIADRVVRLDAGLILDESYDNAGRAELLS